MKSAGRLGCIISRLSRTFHFSFFTFLLFISCASKQEDANVLRFQQGDYALWLEAQNDSVCTLHLSVRGSEVNSIPIRHPVYRLDGGDLDGDGMPEVCLGVENATRYWHQRARRIHIYRLYHGRYIRPLWLGSRVGSELDDFEVCRDSTPAVIHTFERKADGSPVCREYVLEGFGLQFVREL